MKFTFSVNRIIQGISMGTVLINQYSGIVSDPGTKAKIDSIAIAATAIAGLLAHFRNPDGTNVRESYEAKPVVPKMPDNWKDSGVL